MTRRLATIFCMALLLTEVTASPVLASDSPISRASLRGISTVEALVERLPAGAKVLGLTEGTIQTDVELKLRLAGIRVETSQETQKPPGMPELYIEVNITDPGGAASITVQLDQNAILERNGELVIGVPTWSANVVIEHPTSQGIRSYIKDLVDMFLNAWLSVNPKK
jgi:hypothetical protein